MFYGTSQHGTDVSNTANKKYLNTGYIMYNDVGEWDDVNGSGTPRSDVDTKYVFAQPIGSNTTHPETWRYHVYGQAADHGYKNFIPDDSTHFVVGDVVLANGTQMAVMTEDTPSENGHMRIDSISTYQFARQPSEVRATYNFTIGPDDFEGVFTGRGEGEHFFANADWWATNQLNGVFIAEASIGNAAIQDLSAGKIKAGTIEAKVKVGGDTKILIDGPNSRIVISD
jgi:hypothetical protein